MDITTQLKLKIYFFKVLDSYKYFKIKLFYLKLKRIFFFLLSRIILYHHVSKKDVGYNLTFLIQTVNTQIKFIFSYLL